MNEIAVQTESQPLTAVQVRAQVNLVQEVMKAVMQEGQHYGKIPGCGDKPTLLKPGAEKLSMAFHLRPIIAEKDIVVTDMGGGHREIVAYCHILNMLGEELATGIGSCSTMESKYRYRGGLKISTGKAIPKEYWNLKKEGKQTEAQALIGGPGFGTVKEDSGWEICELGEKVENPDIADQYNTVLKMAKKRAYVDGILSATAASDIFTQDIEDMSTAEVLGTKSNVGKPPVAQPQAKTTEPITGKLQNCVTVREFGNEMFEKMTSTGFKPLQVLDGLTRSTSLIATIAMKSGGTKEKSWTRYTITLVNGFVCSTFDKKIAEAAKTAKEMELEVTIQYTTGQYGNEAVSLVVDANQTQQETRQPGDEDNV